MILGDRDRLRQLLSNLVDNAIKFTKSGGHVKIDTRMDGPSASLVVADTGRGIAPEHLARVFEPFVQVNMRLTRIHGGTGLGLAISRNFARAMGGDLTVESEEGRGSTFSLSLPRIN